MASIPNLLVNAVTTFDGKALGKGEKQINKLSGSAKNLAKTFGLAFSATSILAFGKASVKAAADDQKAQVQLALALKNVGLERDAASSEAYIQRLQSEFGVVDNLLRPAFQGLAIATKSASEAQRLLNIALDVSAATGKDLSSVSAALSKAYLGNNAALSRLGVGISKADLASKSFFDVTEQLAATFKGSAQKSAKTFAGSIAKLGVASENVKEIIGTGLIDALKAVGKNNSIDELTASIESGALATGDFIRGLGEIASFNIGGKNKSFAGTAISELKKSFSAGPLGLITRSGQKSRIGTGGGFAQGAPAEYQSGIDARAQAARDKAAAKAAKDAANAAAALLAASKKSTLAKKNDLALSKAAAVFDSTRISLAAALQSTFDKETRLRLEALQAIEEDNGDLAIKKINELGALQRNADLMKLAGITEISNATLLGLNTQLLKELQVINSSKMAEADKELARQDAFGKYNSAIKLAGTLALAESYSERVQIQLTEIARLASLSNTTGASNTLALLRQTVELEVINTIAAAQKLADDNRLNALQNYISLLSNVGAGGGAIGPGMSSNPFQNLDRNYDIANNLIPVIPPNPTISTLIPGVDYNPSQNLDRNYDITINAGVIADPLAFTGLVQETIQRINRGGDPLLVAGII
jgi:hypothetical protein